MLKSKELEYADELQNLYGSVGVTTDLVSATTDENFSHLLELMKNKTSLVAGHSGVGKSTLLNRLFPQINQTVNAISNATNKGTHTTTFAEMFLIDPTTFVIDTPGIKEWGLADMEPQEISDYFPEMRELRLECKFGSRCLHLTEPLCAIRTAVADNRIARSRYDSYVSIVMGEDNRK